MRNNLHFTKQSGYKSGPFDLCITPYDALYKCIQSDFKLFFDDLHLIYGMNAYGDRSNCGGGHQNITNSYGIVFNHEGSTHSHLFNEGRNDDDFYIRDDFYQFRKRYTERIKNFLNYIEENDDIVLVHKKQDDVKVDMDVICGLFKEKYTNKQFSVLEL